MAAEDFKEAPSRDERDTARGLGRCSLACRCKYALRNAAATLLLPVAKLNNLRGCFIAILTYHRVLPDFPPGSPSTGSIEPGTFAAQLELLIRQGYDVLSLEGLGEVIRGESEPPSRAVVITFDGGYADNYLMASKIGLEHEVPLNFFLPTGIIGRSHWPEAWDKHTPQEEWHMARYPELWRPLTWAEVQLMRKGGAQFGCQGYRHPGLDRLGVRELEEEVERSLLAFEEHMGCPARFFSVPTADGVCSEAVLTALKARRIEMAFSSFPQRLQLPYHDYLFPRIAISEFDSLGAFSRKIQGAHDVLYRFCKPLGDLL